MPPLVTPRPARVPLTPPQTTTDTSALLWVPHAPQPLGLILAHGAGTDLHHPFQQQVAAGLAERGFPVGLFNFAYTELARRTIDLQPRLLAAWRDAVAALAPQLVGDPQQGALVLGGRSMGGRMASLLLAEDADATAPWRCAGLAFLAYPLHPPGKPERLRTAHWPALDLPLLFVHGDRDTLNDLGLFARERGALPGPVTEHVLVGADHGFRVRRADGRAQSEIVPEVVDALERWLLQLLAETPR